MKRPYIIFALFSVALLGGCERERPVPQVVEVVINGGISNTRAEMGQIIPQDGLPEEQLSVGIVTVNFRTSDPTTIQPDVNAWKGTSADFTRGYFGGPGLGASPVTNGEIKYTNEYGTVIQKVFYDETGEHYFIRVVYPYQDAELIQTDNGAAVVFSELDGSQDILCSNLGWGNITNPEISTNETDRVVIFSHMLSLFRIKIEPENETAAAQYGLIKSIRIIDQPSSIIVGMIDLATEAYSSGDTDYYCVGFTPCGLTSGPVDAGYIMALPERKFTIEAETQNRLWLSVELDFATALEPYKTSAAGTVYDVTVKFMESYELKLEVSEAKEWWMNSEFD